MYPPLMELPPGLIDPGPFRARCRAVGTTVTSGPVPWSLDVPGDHLFLLVVTDGRAIAAPAGWALERDDELGAGRRRFIFRGRGSTTRRPPVELGAPYLEAQMQTWFVGFH